MGNTHVKPRPRTRNKKQVHWKAADRPSPPGKPQLVPQNDQTPDIVTIRWPIPKSDGGSPITGFLVEHRRTGSSHWVRASPLLVRTNELILSGLEPGWRYQFRVSAENAVGMSDPGEVSEHLTITLQRSAITAPLFTDELKDKVVLENEKTDFVVHFLGQPPPSICWFKDGFEIFSSRTIRILTELDRSILTIHQTALGDEGEIKCAATNRAGHASTKARLTIEAPPRIRLPRQYEEGLLFELGELIRLKVSLAGRPAPLVFWSHDGESIQSSDRYEIETFEKYSVLKIANAHRTDRGEYQIKAINKLGEDHTSFLVTVTDKPSSPGRARVVMTLGRSVTLSWSTPDDDGGCKIGNYIVEYYRLGWNVWLKAATSRQLTTILGDLIEGSEYKFRVKAVSPYGVSEPSEESEVIFIPDAKRGIITPAIRSRSQPRDIFEDMTVFKNQSPSPVMQRAQPLHQRSQSSTRVEKSIHFYDDPDPPPVRPERTKIKSPPKTPEISPFPRRKHMLAQTINKDIFDRNSFVRELTYGSPDMKPTTVSTPSPTPASPPLTPRVSPIPREELKPPKLAENTPLINIRRSRSRSPSPIKPQHSPKTSALEVNSQLDVQPPKSKSPSPSSPVNGRDKSLKRDHFSGSSEFMLVLYPDENDKGLERPNFEDDAVAPPLSLSAPELGAVWPDWEHLKSFASSTELLHERAMNRFYEAAKKEEEELEKRRANEELRQSVPKIKINSIDDDDIVGLERKHSFRRLSAGVMKTPLLSLAQRRHSLKTFSDVGDILENKLQKSPFVVSDKRRLQMNRERSLSEEKEEEEFEKVRTRMALEQQPSVEKKPITVADEDKWLDEYEESVSEESTSSEERENGSPNYPLRLEDDEDTYHPGLMVRQLTTFKKSEEPFEILTKPNPLPDPNFIPKPILKRRDHNSTPSPDSSPSSSKSDRKSRNRSLSLTLPEETQIGRQRSFSLIPDPTDSTDSVRATEDRGSVPHVPGKAVGAVASITGITAAGFVIPDTLLKRKKAEEEAKVVADHYADLVRSYGQRSNRGSTVYTDRESLKKAAEMQEEKEVINVEVRKVQEVSSVRPLAKPLELNHERGRNSEPIGKTIRNASPLPKAYQRKASKTQGRVETKESKSRTPSKSPVRIENRSPVNRRSRGSSPSPPITTNRKLKKSPSPGRRSISPSPLLLRKPKMREITTQTSIGLESFSSDSYSRSPTPGDSWYSRQEELNEVTKVRVRGAIDYLTDLAMFAMACWLYLFDNELLAVPVLLVMVYRQLSEEVRRRVPKWVLFKFKKKDKE